MHPQRRRYATGRAGRAQSGATPDYVYGAVKAIPELPKEGGTLMGEERAGSTGQDSCQENSPLAQRRVTYRVDPRPDVNQSPGCELRPDLTARESRVAKLPSGDKSVLRVGQFRDLARSWR